MYERFIDTGHYRSEIQPFVAIVEDFINKMSARALESLRAAVLATDTTNPPEKTIREYVTRFKVHTHSVCRFEILEKLGEGSFGCVYRVRKRGQKRQLALKEV